MGRALRWSTALAAALTVLLVGPGVAPAWAAPDARIQDVQVRQGAVHFVLSAEGLEEGQSIDPASVVVTLDGISAPTQAVTISESEAVPRRTVMLALDSSGSMASNDKLEKAQEAALTYLEGLPADVEAGLIGFADSARVLVRPTTDRARVAEAVQDLEAEGATAMYDAVVLAVDTLGDRGSRNIVLLSDGQDEGSETSASQAARTVRRSGVVLDAVSLGTGKQEAQLAALARAGNGTTVTATDTAELNAAFESAARTVGTQLAVVSEVPEGLSAGTFPLAVTASAGRQTISDSAVAVIRAPTSEESASAWGPIALPDHGAGLVGSAWFLLLTVVLVFVGLLALAVMAVGALDVKNRRRGRISRRLDEVTIGGAPLVAPAPSAPETVLGDSATVRMAVSLADRVASSRDATAVSRKLEAANLALRPGEWVVVHALIAILAGLLSTLLTNFNMAFSLVAFVLGLVVPWVYLTNRADRRRKSFYEALPDAMQMLAGSLSAGYSLSQALDNVAREAGGPMSEELNRALLESRLGLPLEEGLEAIAQRMQSTDFHWIVMAIRINRQVGGNLAEVLTKVARTIRERERLRRQVRSLSAEGVLSAWVLGILPIAIGAFVALTRPSYLAPLFTTPLGLLMVAMGLVLYVIGLLWMRNLVRMEV